jgi:hypothetical protein
MAPGLVFCEAIGPQTIAPSAACTQTFSAAAAANEQSNRTSDTGTQRM